MEGLPLTLLGRTARSDWPGRSPRSPAWSPPWLAWRWSRPPGPAARPPRREPRGDGPADHQGQGYRGQQTRRPPGCGGTSSRLARLGRRAGRESARRACQRSRSSASSRLRSRNASRSLSASTSDRLTPDHAESQAAAGKEAPARVRGLARWCPATCRPGTAACQSEPS